MASRANSSTELRRLRNRQDLPGRTREVQRQRWCQCSASRATRTREIPAAWQIGPPRRDPRVPRSAAFACGSIYSVEAGPKRTFIAPHW